jgi:hypothetical protein
MRIDEALVTYGDHLERKGFAPGLSNIDEATRFMFEEVARYRQSHPGTIKIYDFPEVQTSSISRQELDELGSQFEEEEREKMRDYQRAIEELVK